VEPRRSRTGRALIAVRDNQLAAESVSIDSTKLKLMAFVLSGALAGFAGSIYVIHQRGLFTGSFDSDVSVRLFSMVVIGGLGSLPGAILGAAYVQGAEFFLTGGYTLLASGAGILLLLMFLPEGLGGIVYALRDSLLRRIARRRKIVVPSLLADVRLETDTPEIDMSAVLSGGGLSSNGHHPVRRPVRRTERTR
jgi:branched-chain amino acid transport system permease protein